MANTNSGYWMMAAANRVTPTRSGAIAFAGTRKVFSDHVGTRLISNAAIATVHTHTVASMDHQPPPNFAGTASGSSPSRPPAGAGAPTETALAEGGGAGEVGR